MKDRPLRPLPLRRRAVAWVVMRDPLATETTPLTTLTHTYDALGRTLTGNIGATGANTSTVVYDTLGRVSSVTNPLGAFTYGYVNVTSRVASVAYHNGQSSSYTYYPNSGDQRLAQITHLSTWGSLIAQHSYTYDAAGNILTWQQQIYGTPANVYSLENDAADQLRDATLTNTSTNAVVHRYAYGYDPAGNRSTQQADNNVATATYNSINQLTGTTGGGQMRFAGTMNEAAKVTVNGAPAKVSGTTFEGSAQVATGVNTITVTMTDNAGRSLSHGYQVTVTANPSQTLTYDLNGNLLADGTRTLQWDAANRLVGITYPSTGNQTTFTYDGLGRRVSMVQSVSGTVTSTQQWVWNGTTMVEERNGSNVVTKRFYGQGEQIAGTSYFYARDHLGSVLAMTDTYNTVQAQYSYDPYGNQTKVSGSLDSDFQYAGYYYLPAPSGIASSFALNLTLYRAYHPAAGRWLNRDPIGERGGINLYGYVADSPMTRSDPLGLTYLSNAAFLLDFLTGGGETDRYYGPNDFQTQELASSVGAAKMRNYFSSNPTNPDYYYPTTDGFVDTIANPLTADWGNTATQVGGFRANAQDNGNGTITYTVHNTAGTQSFFYHGPKDRPPGSTGPCRTIEQTFQWTEPTQLGDPSFPTNPGVNHAPPQFIMGGMGGNYIPDLDPNAQ